ncbi:hypothetical protein [Paraflavitalea speifideaquila]|uniref:hypothetical protein n=1 Tax=Paraflavitalea speifideaquila TaxID=3076558 RepID=UPI0028EF91F5|nr:hypothetical protein [Paraflavitalea speifideiaquila]
MGPQHDQKAVTQLAVSLQKPVLKLTNNDYNTNGLSDLLVLYGQAYDINIEVFNWLQHTITGWPGGKPGADDTNRPERAQPAKSACCYLVHTLMMILFPWVAPFSDLLIRGMKYMWRTKLRAILPWLMMKHCGSFVL